MRSAPPTPPDETYRVKCPFQNITRELQFVKHQTEINEANAGEQTIENESGRGPYSMRARLHMEFSFLIPFVSGKKKTFSSSFFFLLLARQGPRLTVTTHHFQLFGGHCCFISGKESTHYNAVLELLLLDNMCRRPSAPMGKSLSK